MTDDAYTEILALRERLARLEALARQPRPGHLEDAIADAATQPKPDPARRKLENTAKFYSPSEEDAFRQREKVGAEKYDAELARMGGSLLEQSIALAGREAHVKLGRALPAPEED